MQRFKAAFFVTCLGTALLGCGEGQQGPWLEQRQRRLELELAEKMELAQHLNERRQELRNLETELAALKAGLGRPDAEELTRALSIPGVDRLNVHEQQGTVTLSLGGTGGARQLLEVLRMGALSASERALALKSVTVEHRRWAAELETPATPKPEPKPAAQEKIAKDGPMGSANVMPKASLLERISEGDELERRRRQVEQTEQRIAELDKVLLAVRMLNQRKVGLEAQVRALKELNPRERLVGQRPLVEALFGGKKPRLTVGVAEFQGSRLTLKALEKGDAAKRLASLAEVGPVLQSDADTIVLSTAGQP
jgi:hypothetical protein